MLPLIGGILMGLTPSPVEAWPLAWIALVPLWFLLGVGRWGDREMGRRGDAETRGRGDERDEQLNSQFDLRPSTFDLRPSTFCGLIWGIGYHGLALFWITGIHPMDWMGVPWLASIAIAIFCWTFITLWGAFLVAIWAAGMAFFQKATFLAKETERPSLLSTLVRVLIGTALWCALEALWSASPLWWTSLSYTQSPHNLLILHLGQLSGPTTITAAIVAVNGLLAESIAVALYQVRYNNLAATRQKAGGRRQKEEELSSPIPNPQFPIPHSPIPIPHSPFPILNIAIGLLIVLHLIGFGLYNRPLSQPTATALKVGIIQGNIPNEIKLYSEGWRRALRGYTSGYEALAEEGVEAVLTPEVALPFLWDEVRDSSPFYSAILDKGILAWVGAFGKQGGNFTNSLFTVTGTGETVSRFNKVKLVPLGEYIPFEKVVGSLVDRLSPLNAHLVAGEPTQIMETPFGRAIVGICYESAFTYHFQRQAVAGGQFILTASNNDHYSETMPAQHHAQDVIRAVETDRWAVRATNTGYSGVVDPHGRTRWLSGINTYEIHADTIYRRQTKTLYVRWGDWLTPILLGLALISWLIVNRK
ncbi:MAG: apolipoprotein N-acyltransferase [Symploca sp. SIO1A3]|nr:apolipoprotein N-acyltransferase [Symploca sp. SIO1A3]